MIRKAILGGLLATVLGTFVFGRDLWSYVSTGARSVRTAVKQEVPVEFEIERARTMMAELQPEIRRSMHVIAEEQVEIERLRQSQVKRDADLAEQKKALLTLTEDLKSGVAKVSYGGRAYSRKEVEKDLANRFRRFQLVEETVRRDNEILTAKEQALAAHKEKLETMLGARKDLDVEIERLQARLRSVQAAETMCDLKIDDSQLSRCKSLLANLNKELDVRERLVTTETTLTGTIPVQAKGDSEVDLATKIDQYFQGQPTETPEHVAAVKPVSTHD